MPKIAISSKEDQKLLGIDANAASNLVSALGFSEDLVAQVTPVAALREQRAQSILIDPEVEK